MGWLGCISIAVCGLATYLAFRADSALRFFTLINLIANFWSLGIMYNYGPGKIASNYEHFVITLNTITFCIGVILLIIVLVF